MRSCLKRARAGGRGAHVSSRHVYAYPIHHLVPVEK